MKMKMDRREMVGKCEILVSKGWVVLQKMEWVTI
jgi:hypothetical protein